MSKNQIKISLTEFLNFVNKSGSAKSTVVSKAKNKREEEYKFFQDYWNPLKIKIKSVHRKRGTHDDLKELLEKISAEKKDNYRKSIDGYCAFWKKRNIEWFNPPRKTWIDGDLRIELNPELGLQINEKLYVVKLHTSANDSIDKRHADLILNLMEKELREKVAGDEVIFAVLDVKKGKLFENKNKDVSLMPLLKGEVRSFETIWKNLV